MFSNALKSISSTNITGNYSISQNSTSTAGPWKIYDAKKKSTGKPYSVFVFDRKSLDSHGNSLSRSSAAAFKRTADEVVDRLKREASALARLRHPSVLELVEPVEETRGGGLQFVTEPVTASLASLLQEKDDQERSGGPGGRSSRYVTEDSDGTRRRREIEIDELEIQKGLLQISKALEFLHENAGLVHGNLTPDAILINAKSDWKISGLSYCSPPEGSTKPTSFQPISLSEVLNPDPRLPRFVQINLDYTSPDFVMDNNLTTSADMFSLGILGVALYNSPHRSPIESNQSLSNYKRVFSSSSTTPSVNNNFCSARPLPKELSQHVLPRLITRRPAQRMTAKEFQMSEYFDNVLVSTIRFLDSFPAKTPNEKAQFMRGLNKVLPSFPKSVMEKKLLPALLEELKDKDLVSLILQNVFKIIDLLPSGRRAFGDKVRAKLKELFVTNVKNAQEKDPARDAGLMVVLENLATIATICGGKEFKDDILPIVGTALESPTPSVIDAALRSLPVVLPVLDFSTIKNELFPVIAVIFSRTNSLAIKVRGLQAFVILCGGSNDPNDDGGLDGLNERKAKSSSSSALDKYTMQEKIVPLIKVIKTKEPAVMIAALNVLRVVGKVADAEFVAMEILPILWNMSLGPLLDLKQFQTFMELIKTLSKRVEDEQIKKLQELTGTTNGNTAGPNDDFMSFGGVTGTQFDATSNGGDDDFESLVKGKPSGSSATNPMDAGAWDSIASGSGSNVTSPGVKPSVKSPTTAPTFSWSTPNNSTPSLPATVKAQASSFRTVTPDLGSFQTLAPSNTQYSQPLQPQSAFAPPPQASSTSMASTTGSVNWSSAATTPAAANPWASSASSTSNPMSSPPATSSFGGGLNSSMSSLSMNSRPTMSQQTSSSFSLPPPPSSNSSFGMSSSGMGSGMSSFSLAPPPSASTPQPSAGPKYGAGLSSGGTAQGTGMGIGMGMSMANNSMNSMSASGMGMGMAAMMAQQQPKQQTQTPLQSNSGSGLDKFQSLL